MHACVRAHTHTHATSYIYIHSFIPPPPIHSPWYNRTGWLGVKYQLTYLPLIHTCMHACAHTHTHTHIHTHTHNMMNIHIYLYACKLDSKSVTSSYQKYILGHPKFYMAFKHRCSFSKEYSTILDCDSICTVYTNKHNYKYHFPTSLDK